MNNHYKIEHECYTEETNSYLNTTLSYKELGCLIRCFENILYSHELIEFPYSEHDDPMVSGRMLAELFPVRYFNKDNGHHEPLAVDIYFFCSSGCFHYEPQLAQSLFKRYAVTEKDVIAAFKLAMAKAEQNKRNDNIISHQQLYRQFMRQIAHEWQILICVLADKSLSLGVISKIPDDEMEDILGEVAQRLLDITRQMPTQERMDEAIALVSRMQVTLFAGLRDYRNHPPFVREELKACLAAMHH